MSVRLSAARASRRSRFELPLERTQHLRSHLVLIWVLKLVRHIQIDKGGGEFLAILFENR